MRDFTDNADVEAYTAKMNESGTAVTLTQNYQVPAGAGVLLKRLGDNTTDSVNVISSAPKQENNQLVGAKEPVAAETLITLNAYILVDNQFCKVGTDGTGFLSAGLAYLVP